MNTQRFLNIADRISTWAGKASAWLIIGLMLVVCVEVFKRYILNAPTAYIYDVNNMLYGTLFMMCGATRWRRTRMFAATSCTARCARARRRVSTSCCTSRSSSPASSA
jgi:TRAP-type C4-dicarboxylate transport system permease small subunit